MLSGVFLFWGLSSIKSILWQVILLMIRVLDNSINSILIFTYIFEGLITLTLIIFVISVFRMPYNKGIRNIYRLNLTKSKLKSIGIIVATLSISNYLLTTSIEYWLPFDLESFTEENNGYFARNFINLQLIIVGKNLMQSLLIFFLYFLLVKKIVAHNESFKLNDSSL